MNQTEKSYLGGINVNSCPSDLKITDMRFVDIIGAPMHCTLMKLYTNQGLVGYGEVRDGASKTYALMLKSRLLGENPCNIDKLFRRIKQFGGHARQGGGVCAVELALWDLAGKAYGVPVYQMLGGKFRDKVCMYCDTDIDGRDTGVLMGQALKKRLERGFTFLKMDLGINQIIEEPGTLNAPLGFLEDLRHYQKIYKKNGQPLTEEYRNIRNRWFDLNNIAHPFTGIHITEKGLDMLEQYVADVRAAIGYEVPLAIDHFGHLGLDDSIQLARRIEKYHPAWLEDMVPWQMTGLYKKLSQEVRIPICTGEDIYLKENFLPLLESGGVSVIHPDLLTSGGILETKKIGDLAQDYGVSMAIHMAESPIACMAAVHCAAATENFMALEYHAADVPWWNDMAGGIANPLVENGYITVPDTPGLGIGELNDEVLQEHIHPDYPGLWESTEEWDKEWSNDRLWS